MAEKTDNTDAPDIDEMDEMVPPLMDDAPEQGSGPRDINFLLDIPLKITVELGRTRMLISELLKTGQGSVIELEKVAGEPLEILANERLIAKGEVVSVNDKYGIRITEIISPAERIERLG